MGHACMCVCARKGPCLFRERLDIQFCFVYSPLSKDLAFICVCVCVRANSKGAPLRTA